MDPGTGPQFHSHTPAASAFEWPTLQDFRASNDQLRPGVPVGYLPMVSRAVLPYLEIESLLIIPDPAACHALIATFMTKFHQFCPVVDFLMLERSDVPESTKIALKQAICLVASKDLSTKQLPYVSRMGCSSRP